MRLSPGLVAVVTGAASGIGLVVATAFAEAGLRVALTDVEDAALGQAVRELRAAGHDVAGTVTDVSSLEQLRETREWVLRTFGRVDVLVNNAGVVGPRGPCWELSERDWQWVLGVNLHGALNGIRAFVPGFVAQDSGHVVTIASMGGLLELPGNAPYAASKHAIVAVMDGLAGELNRVGAHVGATVVCPGQVRTRIHESERNRPEQLESNGATPSTAWPRENRPPSTLTLTDVARATVAGIEQDRLLVMPTPGSAARVLARAERLVRMAGGEA
ncbi:SDR family NAD(P)-dependent oxidoreductase [Nocardia sp. CA-135953]|uniref:SDR family NAD(P)-dependent oxidoreductase n=1 Tax=Nocardia sp. CA-135953 TaxID=3239978 RepID=UPI003D97E94E